MSEHLVVLMLSLFALIDWYKIRDLRKRVAALEDRLGIQRKWPD